VSAPSILSNILSRASNYNKLPHDRLRLCRYQSPPEMIARASPAQVTSVKLSETAMLIYIYIQSRSGDSVRLRDIQRAMNFSSPSSALFHLQKLESAGLVQKDNVGDYRIKTRVRVSLVRNFLIIKGALIPRHLFYASATTAVSILYFVLLSQFLSSP